METGSFAELSIPAANLTIELIKTKIRNSFTSLYFYGKQENNTEHHYGSNELKLHMN